MKKLLYLFILLFILGCVNVPPESGALQGQQIIATQPFPCNGEQQTAVWENDKGRDIKVRQMEVWPGMYKGGIADFWFWVSVDGNTMGHTNWDHYADPTQPHNLRYEYAPDYIVVGANQTVQLGYGCNDVSGAGGQTVGDLAVTIWWLE